MDTKPHSDPSHLAGAGRAPAGRAARRLDLRTGDAVVVDDGRFAIGRTATGRIVLIAGDGSRAWIDETGLATLHACGRLRVVERTGRRPADRDRRGPWVRR